MVTEQRVSVHIISGQCELKTSCFALDCVCLEMYIASASLNRDIMYKITLICQLIEGSVLGQVHFNQYLI